MNMVTKHEVLADYLQEWLACKDNKKERGLLNKKLASSLKMNEKSIARAMRRIQLETKASVEKRGRSIYDGKDVDAALSKIWTETDHLCAESLHGVVTDYVQYFIQDKLWNFSDDTTDKLCAMSLGTMKLRIGVFRKKAGLGRGRSATVSSPLKGMIPIRKSHTWTDLPPGHVQTDSVVHCGDILTGDVIYSVGCVDYATYWSEYTDQWNKGMMVTCDSFKLLRTRFPFALVELHPDTGNEFINYHVHKRATEEGLQMTRSEPHKKNDNMCIEERKNNIARRHLGYARLDNSSLVAMAQEILNLASQLHNHFRPVRRMISKVRVGAKWKRTIELVAKTPYVRILERDDVSQTDKKELRQVHQKLNSLQLKRELDRLKEKLSREVLKFRKIS